MHCHCLTVALLLALAAPAIAARGCQDYLWTRFPSLATFQLHGQAAVGDATFTTFYACADACRKHADCQQVAYQLSTSFCTASYDAAMIDADGLGGSNSDYASAHCATDGPATNLIGKWKFNEGSLRDHTGT